MRIILDMQKGENKMNINPAEIRSLQKEKGLTGYKLAELANLRPQSLSTIKKRGTTTPTVARAIARALGVSLEEITEPQKGGEAR